MQIGESELYITIEIDDDGSYNYYCQKPEEKKPIYFGNEKKEPNRLPKSSKTKEYIIDKIKLYIPPHQYKEDGIEVYYEQQMLELKKELQTQKDNQKKPVKTGDFNVKGYSNEDGIYYKIKVNQDGKIIKQEEVVRGIIKEFCRISDFSSKTSNNFEMKLIVKVEEGKKWKEFFFNGNKDEIVNSIIRNDLGWNKQSVQDFIYKFVYENSLIHDKRGVVGGYESWSDIKKAPIKKDLNMEELLDYFKTYLTPQHLSAIKALILIPFHTILRQEEGYMSRQIVRFVVLHGAPSAFKNGIVNIVRNMFDFHTTYPIDSGGTPNTYAALRNEINNNLGIILCDESEGAFLDESKKFYNTSAYPVENLLKGVFQYGMPTVADNKIIGDTKDQVFNGTPVFTWNDSFRVTEALKDRCFAINFEESFNTNYEHLFEVDTFKKELLYFGETFASCLAYNWEKLKKIRNYEELINTVFKLMQEEYKLDTQFLIDQEILDSKETINIKQTFFDILRYKIYQFNDRHIYIENNYIDADMLDKLDSKLFIRANSKSVYMNKDAFIHYIRDHVVKDRGLKISQIIKAFEFEYNKEKETYIWKVSNRECYRIKTNIFFSEVHRIDINDEKAINESVESVQSSIDYIE